MSIAALVNGAFSHLSRCPSLSFSLSFSLTLLLCLLSARTEILTLGLRRHRGIILFGETPIMRSFVLAAISTRSQSSCQSKRTGQDRTANTCRTAWQQSKCLNNASAQKCLTAVFRSGEHGAIVFQLSDSTRKELTQE